MEGETRERASTAPLAVATRVGRRTCLAAGGAEPKRRATRPVEMTALKKEAAFSPSSTAGLGPDPMPRIERKIAAFMGGRRCERGTTAVLLRRAAPVLCCAAVSVRAATVAGKGDPVPPRLLAAGQIAQCSLVLRPPVRPHDSRHAAGIAISSQTIRVLADLAALRASELASPCGRNQSRNRNFPRQGNPPPQKCNAGKRE